MAAHPKDRILPTLVSDLGCCHLTLDVAGHLAGMERTELTLRACSESGA